jgi:hypothetical protein
MISPSLSALIQTLPHGALITTSPVTVRLPLMMTGSLNSAGKAWPEMPNATRKAIDRAVLFNFIFDRTPKRRIGRHC